VLQSRTARWMAATALLCAMLLAVAWFLVVSPRRAAAAEVQAQVLQEQQHNDVLATEVEQLKAGFAELPLTRSKLAAIRRQLPADVDMPGLVRTVESLAAGSGATLLSITPGEPQPLGAGGEVLGPSATKAVLQATPMVIVIDGDYFQAVSFVRQLQTGVPRAFLISGLQIAKQGSASTAGSAVSMTITGKVFSMPDGTTATGAAGSAGKAAAPVATPAATPVPTPAATPAATPAVTPAATSGAAIALPALTSGGSRW